jgi:glyoxylase-like metal-dependent hydrolase (beta-lactamase superfamily II)
MRDALAAGLPVEERRVWEVAPGLGCAHLRSPASPPATHTSCFVIGTEELLVVDPGGAEPEEQGALDEALAALGRPVVAIWLTHHHLDHVAGVEALRARHPGVQVAAHRGTADLLAGQVRVDRLLEDDEVMILGTRRLRAIHTPGHAAGHLCFLEEATRYLLAGDLVAGVGTVVIDPDGGDMQAYLDSLTRLEALRAQAILPAHGPFLTEPAPRLAHLIKLVREGRAREEGGRYTRPG